MVEQHVQWTNKTFLKEACDTIANNLGENSAKTFENFFRDESIDGIERALQELLINFVGDENTKKALSALISKAKLAEGNTV